ncbi:MULTISPECIES: DUF5959 family protein [unclassified Streptomyces]|uniref:DUF5959 family protein n=1 Tax=unclassified Streptomyces TaxID=2593676 RepID=UPI00081DB3AB|nr:MULTISPECIES: DUF5959 family protein [unclassified Streptomyces]MYZ35752.1 hypothetical protein [Streptomyces sp. SID4917]SCF78100.1 hypothetical protein GA0115259_102462 [Streptomyces sp. MnatMP-M17]
MDLINLSDGNNSVRLHLLGRHRPGILPEHDLMDAEIIVDSDFISGRFLVHFFLSDLKPWSLALHSLENGQNAEWLDMGNGPTIRIECAGSDDDDSIVFIEDTSGSGTTAIIPIALDPGWVQAQREHLNEAVKTWPMEVVKTSPGSYEWKS